MKTTGKKIILILGNGGAAAHAIMAARKAGFDGEIHLVSDTDSPAFNPMLAPYYLKGSLSWRNCFPFGTEFYNRHNVICHFGSAVDNLDANRKLVLLAEGKQLNYDHCLIATGARAIIPPVPGLRDSPHAFPLRTADDTVLIKKEMQSAQKVIVLGASLVGVKLAEILHKKNIDVILLDVASQMLPRGAHPQTATKLQAYFEEQGIEMRIGSGLEGLEQKGDGVCCFFPDQVTEDADFVAVCTGIKPNLQFLDPDQVQMKQAIVVNKFMQTSAQDLYAAGDVCQGLNRQTGESQWLGTWGNACYQGRTAGLNMAGVATAYEGIIPQHVSPFFDWTYTQFGDVNRQGQSVRIDLTGTPDKEGGYRLLVYENDILVGANILNCCDDIGDMKRAITLKQPWNQENSMLHGYY